MLILSDLEPDKHSFPFLSYPLLPKGSVGPHLRGMTTKSSCRKPVRCGILSQGNLSNLCMKMVMEESKLRVLTDCTSSQAQPLEKEINWCPSLSIENETFLLGSQKSQTGNHWSSWTNIFQWIFISSEDNWKDSDFWVYSLSAFTSLSLFWVYLFSKPKSTTWIHPS